MYEKLIRQHKKGYDRWKRMSRCENLMRKTFYCCCFGFFLFALWIHIKRMSSSNFRLYIDLATKIRFHEAQTEYRNSYIFILLYIVLVFLQCLNVNKI
jgi:uncharacterized Rmd1/YagE family protein